MEITVKTKCGQIHQYVGDYDEQHNREWNEIIRGIIDSEHEYEKTRHQETSAEEA